MQHLVKSLLAVALLFFAAPENILSRSEVSNKGNIETDWQTTADLSRPGEPIVDPYVKWPTYFGVQQTGVINATFDSYGLFGDNATPWNYGSSGWPRVAFESPAGSGLEYLWMGSLWIGGIVGQDTLVSIGMDGWRQIVPEYHPNEFPSGSVSKFEYPTDYSMRALFTDTITANVTNDFDGRPHIPLNIKVANRSHAVRTLDYEDIIIYDLVITNIGTQHIDRAYVGFYADVDAGFVDLTANYWMDDLMGSIRQHGIGYGIDNDGDPDGNEFDTLYSARKTYAVKLLAASHSVADTNFNWWRSTGGLPTDFGPRQKGTAEDPYFEFSAGLLGTPLRDADKYYMLSHREWDYDQVFTASIAPDDPVWLQPPQDVALDITDGLDMRLMMSWGPFDLEPDSSVRLLVATFTADNVHNFALNMLNLPFYPAGYVANLDFTDLLANAAHADELAAYLTNPQVPVPCLHVAYQDKDSAVFAWDPWVFDNIEGYEIFVSEIPPESMPYPSVPAPWLRPQSLVPAASLDLTTRHKITGLDPNRFYFVNVAHRHQSGIGSEGVPLMISGRGSTPGPEVENDYTYFVAGESATLSWTNNTDLSAAFYRIYKFSDRAALEDAYQPFYSQYLPEPPLTPVDSFDIDDTKYYYFAMEPYATVGPVYNSWQDNDAADGACYLVTAVDANGYETEFSRAVEAYEIYPATRDILLISDLPFICMTSFDTVRYFYEDILAGYDFDIYCVFDTVQKYECDHEHQDCINWRDFTRFKLTIIDLDSYDNLVTSRAEERFHRMTKYIESGGKLAYFGCFYGMNDFYSDSAGYFEQDATLIQPYMGIDSLFFYFFNYYYWHSLPLDFDSCFGFAYAEPARQELPTVAFDTDREPFSDQIYYRWKDLTPPSVSTFVPNENAEVIYRYRSVYPELSWLEGHPVGIRVLNDRTDSYTFGFHLWYMQSEPARQLIEQIFLGLPTDVANQETQSVPLDFALRQNYPNPFNPATVICFDLPRNAEVTLEVYNILGQRVKTLLNGRQRSAGSHEVQWDGDSDGGDRVASGIYFYRLRAGDNVATRKMMLLK